MFPLDTRETSDLLDLRDKALGLRESVNGTRARLHNQDETLRRLRAELAELKELARTKAPVVPRRHVSVAKLLPYAVLASFAIISQLPERRPESLPAIAAPARLLRAEPAPSIDPDDDRGDEAIALVHEWRVPGDDRPITERLQQVTELPGARPAWTAERTGKTTYRVSFLPLRAETALEFDVDLDAKRVDPSTATAELLAPHLTAGR